MKAFLMIGQSNMSGRGMVGEMPDIATPHVSVLRAGQWAEAHEPVVLDKPNLAGEGMAIAFGSAVYIMTGEDVGVIPCSLGGTGLDEWAPGQPLFDGAVKAAVAALRTGAELSGVLWHQGERDSASADKAATYLKRLRQMIPALIACVRREAQAEGFADRIPQPLPVLVGELGDYLDFNAGNFYHRQVNAQLHAFAQIRPEYACVRASDLSDKGDALHFSTRSQRELGVRFAAAWAETIRRLHPPEEKRHQLETEFT